MIRCDNVSPNPGLSTTLYGNSSIKLQNPYAQSDVTSVDEYDRLQSRNEGKEFTQTFGMKDNMEKVYNTGPTVTPLAP